MTSKFSFKVRKNYKQLRPSEQKVADFLLRGDVDVMELTIETLAKKAEVSQPTVIRFARAMGLNGFKELKNQLLSEKLKSDSESEPARMISYSVQRDDKLVDVPLKAISTNIRQLENILKNLSAYEFIKAVEIIRKGRKVFIAAAENSGAVAADLATKLMFMGLDATFYSDGYQQVLGASNLGKEDVAVGISYTGATVSTVKALETAREAGAATIAITNYEDAPINRYADAILCSGNEPYIYSKSVFSRCAQLSIVDMLYTGLLLKDFDGFTMNLETRGMIAEEFMIKEK